MGLESLDKAMAVAGLMVAAAQKSAAGGLVSSPTAGQGWGSSTGAKLEQTSHLVGWQFAVVKVIAQRIAAQPVRVGRRSEAKPKKRAGKDAMPAGLKHAAGPHVELLEGHRLLDAMQHPNPYMVGWAFMYLSLMYLESAGEVYWWVTEDAGHLQIWPLAPSWVTPQHEDDALFVSYKVTTRNTGETLDVPGEDIVRISLPDPMDPYTGSLSPLRAAAKAVVADEQIQTAQVRAFQNGIFPGLGVVIGRHPDVAGVPGMRPILTKDQRATLTAAIKQAYRGALNADEPLLLDGLIEDVKKLTNSPAEMGFVESSKLTKGRITQAFGVNPIVMGEVEGANRASATVADEHLCASAVNPLIELMSQVMTHGLAPRIGEPDLLVWIEPARTRDPDAERLDWDQAIKAGAVTVNEVRARIGLEPREDDKGDELVSPPAGALGGGTGGEALSGASFRLLG